MFLFYLHLSLPVLVAPGIIEKGVGCLVSADRKTPHIYCKS
jgi:hypothetical protein